MRLAERWAWFLWLNAVVALLIGLLTPADRFYDVSINLSFLAIGMALGSVMRR